MERRSGIIAPSLWVAGGIIGLAFHLVGWEVCSWIEAIITMIVVFLFVIWFDTKWHGAIGGGLLKGLTMSCIYYGRYVGITIVLFVLSLWVVCIMKRVRGENGNSIVMGIPILMIAVLATAGIIIGINESKELMVWLAMSSFSAPCGARW